MGLAASAPMVNAGFVLAGDTMVMFAVFRIGWTDWATPEFQRPHDRDDGLVRRHLGGRVGAHIRGRLVILGFQPERPAGDGVGRVGLLDG